MRKQLESLFRSGALFLAAAIIILGISQVSAEAAAAPKAAPAAAPTSKEACLQCHGPFDKLAGASPKYVASSGEKITPHRFVPHNSKDAKGIPECSNCHQAHPLPPTAASTATLPKPDVQWCFTCHHKNNFTSCKECHKE